MSVPTSNMGLIDVGIGLALYNKFTQYLGNLPQLDTVLFYPNEVAQREYSEIQGASVVDFISYFRDGTEFSWARNRSPVSFMGVPTIYTDSNMDGQVMVKAIPMDLSYEVVFWHHDLNILNVLVENFFFWIFNSPTLQIDLQGYQTSIYANMTSSPVEDFSTVKNMYQVGKYWVYRTRIKLESWLPQVNLSGGAIHNIICNFWLYNGQTGTNGQVVNMGTVTVP